MWINYGYFVRLPNGVPVAAGNDFGPTEDSYMPGDSMGVKGGKEAIVIAVVKGNAAKRNGFDVMVLLEEREPGQRSAAGPSPEEIDASLRALISDPALTSAPQTIQTEWKAQNKRVVAIWNGVHIRPIAETFHEFLVAVPLKDTFGEAWYKQEISKAESECHAVVRWLRAFRQEGQEHKPLNHKSGEVYGAPATGATTELIALANDLYMLLKVNRLPERLVERLRNYNEFQGARYEIAIAAAFVKCGFELEWIEDRTGPHPEFIARNKQTGEEVAVETKSRRRPGALHQPGDLPPEDELRADVDRLYREALKQDPGRVPFVVFLDVNLPPNTSTAEAAKWQQEIVSRWQGNEQQVSLLGFTNFGWHHMKDKPNQLRTPEFLLSVPNLAVRPLRTPETIVCLKRVLDAYGVAPNEY
ncbi:MAG: hypothetical protein M1453_04515 [Acidobacteria bacterium]|nr:hypothetical protein [Acidobacteriota bacterium]MCL5287243.1 hypothetical protein [Acidobacteriota bacterium]